MPSPVTNRETRRQRVTALLAALKNDRAPWELDWRDLGDFILPTRVQWSRSDRNRGDRRNYKIIDSTASLAARTFGSGMHTHITSPARPWFGLTTSDPALNERDDVKAYLADVKQVLADVLEGSNLYQVLPVVYEDLGVFATAVFACLDDDEDVVRFYDFPIGSYYLATDEKRRVRVFVHEYSLTVRQLIAKFGGAGAYDRNGATSIDWTRFSAAVRSAYDAGRFDASFDVVQVIEPNDEYDPSKLESRFKQFRSCHWEIGRDLVGDTALEEKGFDEFPIFALRWKVRGNDVYGSDSPGKMCIGDVKQLQIMEKRGAMALDKMVSPPLVADPDLMSNPVTQLPGGVNYFREVDGKPRVRPLLELRPEFEKLEQKEEQKRELINQAFYANLFLMLEQLDRAQITAAEIYERKDEKLLAMGSVLERVNGDGLDPMIERVYAICDRAGLLPDPPPSLEGKPLKIEYESIMHQAQRAVSLGAIDRLTTFVANIAKAKADPSVFDKLDLDKAIDAYGDGAGTSPELLVSDEKLQQIRAARASQAQATQQAELFQTAASGAKQLSDTDLSSDNGLTQLLGSHTAAAA